MVVGPARSTSVMAYPAALVRPLMQVSGIA